jgi:hypothetical protein
MVDRTPPYCPITRSTPTPSCLAAVRRLKSVEGFRTIGGAAQPAKADEARTHVRRRRDQGGEDWVNVSRNDLGITMEHPYLIAKSQKFSQI